MKKIYIAFLLLFTSITTIKAQSDTLLYEGFEAANLDYIVVGPPSGIVGDTTWFSFDLDGYGDASGANRPNEWFPTYGFADADTANVVMASNSWTSPADPISNWLITPAVTIADSITYLSWKSAPYQTPLYLDGYKVLISTTDNNDYSFTDTLFVAGEYISGSSSGGNDYSSYQFSDGFLHGEDGLYVQVDSANLSRQTGILRPFNVSLKQYVGQTIHVAFLHDAQDDNLIAIDDILISGTFVTKVKDIAKDYSVSVYPNPARDNVRVSCNLTNSTTVNVKIYDIYGKLVYSAAKGTQAPGKYEYSISLKDLAAGCYNLQLNTSEGNTYFKLIVE